MEVKSALFAVSFMAAAFPLLLHGSAWEICLGVCEMLYMKEGMAATTE
jgi:hypothetical protein